MNSFGVQGIALHPFCVDMAASRIYCGEVMG